MVYVRIIAITRCNVKVYTLFSVLGGVIFPCNIHSPLRESPLSSDFSCIARDITIDLNGYTLESDEEVDWFEGEFIKIEL